MLAESCLAGHPPSRDRAGVWIATLANLWTGKILRPRWGCKQTHKAGFGKMKTQGGNMRPDESRQESAPATESAISSTTQDVPMDICNKRGEIWINAGGVSDRLLLPVLSAEPGAHRSGRRSMDSGCVQGTEWPPSKASKPQTTAVGSTREGRAGSRRWLLRKPQAPPAHLLLLACSRNLSQQSLGAALYQHSSVQTNPNSTPLTEILLGLGLLKFVFCNYFSLLCFFSRFYAKLHGWRVKLCLKDLVFLACAIVGTNFKSCDTITILMDRVTFNQSVFV